jgi:hypothetical protein
MNKDLGLLAGSVVKQNQSKESKDAGRVPLVQKGDINKEDDVVEIKSQLAVAQHEILTHQRSLRSQLPCSRAREFLEGLHSVLSNCYDAALLVDEIGETMVGMVHEDFNAVR